MCLLSARLSAPDSYSEEKAGPLGQPLPRVLDQAIPAPNPNAPMMPLRLTM